MKKRKERAKKKPEISRTIYWAPRILAIVFIAFVSLFALDIFGMNLGFWGTVLGLLMHLIPSFAMIIILIIAWKHEIVGAVAFIALGLAYILSLLMNPELEWYMLSWALTIAGPAFITGILFLMNWKRKKKRA